MHRSIKSLFSKKTFTKAGLISTLAGKTNKITWDKAHAHLIEYNKTIITLSSSALVLSFSVIKIGNVFPNKWLLGTSWLFFLLAILIAILILFITFLYNLAEGHLSNLSKAKNFDITKVILDPEVSFIWDARTSMIWLSFAELLFFFLAMALLIVAAFLSI